ncbi:oligosaccharyltransferase alpha subunit [Lineolata rhizophorae]|uniref:Dolichyl-diphosphooligosaccharide--protein glycosyltransferase subunit 1 n=1 Tax=Lineolata rhizophorae TaxID=578093 RepID=A0A6A6NUC3_9PEZI|nr:oligosaccharyltransferase alpha subunit [Lineolata rhizophorae]
MRVLSAFFAATAALISPISVLCTAEPLSSKQILPAEFKPPQVWKNANLVRNVNLEKGYPREVINVVIENVDKAPQSEYYLPFENGLMARVGGLEVKDKKEPEKGTFKVVATEFDTESATEYYLIHLPTPVEPSGQQTISISYSLLSSLDPVPATIAQAEPQYLTYRFSSLCPSAYYTVKQKTKLKFSSADIPDYTTLPKSMNVDGADDPQVQGSTITYGTYQDTPAGAQQPVEVRYQYTRPLIHVALLQRDIEVSAWGGNLATEERYWLTNRAAALKENFSRVTWQMQTYTSTATSALRELRFPLLSGSVNPYFTDDIGNVSTSRFRPGVGDKDASLELKPRYPVFGGWNYSFKIGWDADLKNFLRKLKVSDRYVLRVPFLEGPRMAEGVEYDRVEVKVILPEGAKNMKYETTAQVIGEEISVHKTFMDTIGRPTLKLSAMNVVDEWRDKTLVVTYDYPWAAGFRKPLTIFATMFCVFTVAWIVGNLDVSIGKKKA